MQIIVCGADEIGCNTALVLAEEGHDVTLIDPNVKKISQISEHLEINVVLGSSSNPEVLRSARAEGADMIIALDDEDEVNMVTCQVAQALFNVPRKIVRISEPDFFQPEWSDLFSRSGFPVDAIISPESIIADAVYRKLSVSGAVDICSLVKGRAQIVGVVCAENCPLIHTAIDQIPQLFPDLTFRIVMILRDGQPFIPDLKSQILTGDEAYFCVDTRHLRRAMAAFGYEEKEAKKLVIAGGGKTGQILLRSLQQKGRGVQLKVIESDREKASFLSQNQKEYLVFHGSCLNGDILEETAVGKSEAYVALTDSDETNILSAALAKKYGCSRVISLINSNTYLPILGQLKIDSVVLSQTIVTTAIRQQVYSRKIRGLQSLRNGIAEVVETEISDSSQMKGMQIKDLSLPRESVLALVLREKNLIVPEPDLVLEHGDHVVVLVLHTHADRVEKFLMEQSDFL